MQINLNDESLKRISDCKKENETEEEFVNQLIKSNCQTKTEQKRTLIWEWIMITVMFIALVILSLLIRSYTNKSYVPQETNPMVMEEQVDFVYKANDVEIKELQSLKIGVLF